MRPSPSMRWTVHGKKSVHSSTSKLLSWSSVQIGPWGGRSMVKNPSTRPSQNYYLGPLSESVHETDGPSPKSWSVVHISPGKSSSARHRYGRGGAIGGNNYLSKFLNFNWLKNWNVCRTSEVKISTKLSENQTTIHGLNQTVWLSNVDGIFIN